MAKLEARLRGGPQGEAAWRIVVRLPTGHEHGEEHVEIYREVEEGTPTECSWAEGCCPLGPDPPRLIYQMHAPDGRPSTPTVSGGTETAAFPLQLHGLPVLGPYLPLEPLQQRRLAARRHTVTYCYDFPSVFENALRAMWAARGTAGGCMAGE